MSSTRLAIALLLADEGMQSVVGGAIFPAVAPQGASMPFVTVRLVSEDLELALIGPTGAYDSRVEVAVHASTYAAADTIAATAIDALVHVVAREVMAGDPPAAIGTATCWKTGTDFTDFSDDRCLYRRIVDFRVRWK